MAAKPWTEIAEKYAQNMASEEAQKDFMKLVGILEDRGILTVAGAAQPPDKQLGINEEAIRDFLDFSGQIVLSMQEHLKFEPGMALQITMLHGMLVGAAWTDMRES